MRGEGAQFHEVFEPAGPDDELADIDRPVSPRHVRDDDVQPRAVRQGGVDEWGGDIQAPPGALQHPLNEVAHLLVRQGNGGQLGFTVACDENFVWGVEPDLFDGRVVQQGLKRPEARHGVEDEPPGLLQRADRRKRRQQGAFVVVADRFVHEPADLAALPQRVEPAATDQLTDFILDDAHGFHGAPNMAAAHPPGAVQLGLKLRESPLSDKGRSGSMWITAAGWRPPAFRPAS